MSRPRIDPVRLALRLVDPLPGARVSRARGARTMALVAGLLAVAIVWAAAPAGVAAEPVGSGGRMRVDLYGKGDFASQTNLVQCVGASMQMMLNMIGPVDDRTAATQARLFRLARSLRDPASTWRANRPGASAAGWARGLTAAGAGPYGVRTAATLEDAVAMAAAAIVATGRPVGLLVWEGAHAWVMSGFEADGDPASATTATVRSVRVLDPLYPRAVGAPWGPGPAPDARLTVGELGRVFVPYRPNGRNAALRGRYVLVLPLESVASARLQAVPA
ncbi:MAG: hypothetical protein MUE82_03865 [Chloroflexi bacterium]|nr:hypothetical protein [Chloroflexota bacterium]